MIAPRAIAAALAIVLAGCVVGPEYRKPDSADLVPADWRWKVAEARDDAPKGEWWKVFADPVLDRLQADALAGSPTLRAAIARVDQARAVARIQRAEFFPQLALDPVLRRERTSGNPPTPIPFPIPSANVNTFSVPLDLSYEIDLWGRVRRSVESARAQAQASAADYENVMLTLTADVAIGYFVLRALDQEVAKLAATVRSRGESLRLAGERYAAGISPGVDLEQARTLLATAESDLADVRRSRAEAFDALAVLVGKPPSALEVPDRALDAKVVPVPAVLPSALLERRPDIARAERALAARNAQIGVARSAYFPAIQLVGQSGFLSDEAGALFTADSRVWSIGPRIHIPLLTGGRTRADVERAEAAYEQALAEYRAAVLVAFREVEDSLAQVVLLGEQARAQSEAEQSAARVVTLAKARYDAGTVNYLELADAERNLLHHERRQAQLQGRRYAAMVHLIKALGGGFEARSR